MGNEQSNDMYKPSVAPMKVFNLNPSKVTKLKVGGTLYFCIVTIYKH